VGDKNNNCLLTEDNNIWHFRGWKNDQFGNAECDTTSSRTFKQVCGAAEWLSVAFDDAGQEKVHHVGAAGTCVLDATKD